MTEIHERKYEFRDWMNAQKLKSETVASRFGIKLQTVRHWRSKGVPPTRQDFVTRTIAEWASGAAIGPRLHIQATDKQFRDWSEAALNEGKILEDWARDGLTEMAREQFTIRALPKVAEDEKPYGTGNG